jgi:hypothetical protein
VPVDVDGEEDFKLVAPPAAAGAFLRNTMVPLLVCLEESGQDGVSPPPGPSSAAAVARLRTCLATVGAASGTDSALAAMYTTWLAISLTTGLPFRDLAVPCMDGIYTLDDSQPFFKVPPDVQLLYYHVQASANSPGKSELIDSSIATDPFLGPVYRRRACRTCQLLPRDVLAPLFQVCSLCQDPAVGRFCCKEPCYAAFWRGGHKKDCAGRHQLKELKKK